MLVCSCVLLSLCAGRFACSFGCFRACRVCVFVCVCVCLFDCDCLCVCTCVLECAGVRGRAVSLVVIVCDVFVCFTLIACVFVFVFLSASVFAGLLYVFVNVLA